MGVVFLSTKNAPCTSSNSCKRPSLLLLLFFFQESNWTFSIPAFLVFLSPPEKALWMPCAVPSLLIRIISFNSMTAHETGIFIIVALIDVESEA